MTTPIISPEHDLALTIDYEQTDPLTGLRSPMITGPVIAMLTSEIAGAVPRDDTNMLLQVDCEMVGEGRWLASFAGSDLTVALLDDEFGAAAAPAHVPWVVFQVDVGGLYPVQCRYERDRIVVPR